MFLPYAKLEAVILQWHGCVRCLLDAYIDREWYKVCISRFSERYTLSIEGNFKYGGHINYESRISRDKVFHAEESFPDFFMIGDPHINFYQGDVYVDDVTLEVPTNP